MVPMDISMRLEFPADPATVAAMMNDEGYLTQVCEASDALQYEVSVSGDTSTMSRTIATPSAAAKFAGSTLTLVQTMAWGSAQQNGERTADLNLAVPGQPVTLKGIAKLTGTDAASVVEVTGDLKVNVPFVGKKLEQAAAPAIVDGIKIQETVGRDWLAQRA